MGEGCYDTGGTGAVTGAPVDSEETETPDPEDPTPDLPQPSAEDTSITVTADADPVQPIQSVPIYSMINADGTPNFSTTVLSLTFTVGTGAKSPKAPNQGPPTLFAMPPSGAPGGSRLNPSQLYNGPRSPIPIKVRPPQLRPVNNPVPVLDPNPENDPNAPGVLLALALNAIKGMLEVGLLPPVVNTGFQRTLNRGGDGLWH
jgi:hypothetical protein